MSLVRVTGALPVDGATAEDYRAVVASQRVVVPEDTIDAALRNAKTEADFDAIYEYSGRPCSGWEAQARAQREAEEWTRQLLENYVDEEDE